MMFTDQHLCVKLSGCSLSALLFVVLFFFKEEPVTRKLLQCLRCSGSRKEKSCLESLGYSFQDATF